METSFCQKALQLESLRPGSFQKHRSSSYVGGESTDEFESEMFNSLCSSKLKKKESERERERKVLARHK